MEVQNEEEDSSPPLDTSLAPALLFDDGAAGEARGGAAALLYSIPQKRALPARGFGRRFVADSRWVTPQGWVLTLDPVSRDASLRDPFSSCTAAVRLPPDVESLLVLGDTTCVLSTPTRRPTDPAGCVVLVAHRKRPVLFYCRPGGSRWLQHEYQAELICDDRDASVKAMARLTAVGGRFYGHLLGKGKVVTLDFSPPEPALTVAHVASSPRPAGCCLIRSWKVESCGELFLVRFCYTPLCWRRILRVEVDRLDWSRSAWVRAAGLGVNRAFFVRTGQFGVSMAADEVGLRPNCVYFTKKKGDKGLYVYDIGQGATTLHDLAPNISDSTEPLLLMPARIGADCQYFSFLRTKH